MILSVMAAFGENYELGLDGKIPWHISEDFKYFKRTTMNHHMLMGRKTYDSIGVPLPGRTTIALSRDPSFKPEGVDVVNSLEAALTLAKSRGESEFFFTGGAAIYKMGLEVADKLYLTRVKYSGKADTYFPKIDFDKFKLTSSVESEKCCFELWERV